MMAGSRPRANLIFSGQVSMSLFRRMARMPLLQSTSSLSTFRSTTTVVLRQISEHMEVSEIQRKQQQQHTGY